MFGLPLDTSLLIAALIITTVGYAVIELTDKESEVK